MFLTTMIGLAVTGKSAQARIVAASLFKNGYAVVMREISVPAPGEYAIGEIPRSSMGTLWFAASDGAVLDSVQTETQEINTEIELSQIETIIAANKGKRVRLGFKNGDSVSGSQVEGKVVSVGSDEVIISTQKGMLVIPKSTITSFLCLQGDLIYKLPAVTSQRILKVRVHGKSGKVTMVSLERGLTWSPGYAIDISDKNKLTLIAKSTVLDDLDDLHDVDARFVTGFPNVPFADVVDPLVSGQSVDAFMGFIQSPAGFQGGGGGFGGGGGRGAMAFRNNSLGAQAVASNFDFVSAGANTAMSPFAGQQIEDLFFYRQGGVTLHKGDRANYVLFKTDAPYKEVYTWDNQNPIVNNVDYRPAPQEPQPPEDVWHTLQFKNTSGRPLTTAPATTFKNGQILGQDTMNYVSTGGDVEIKITKALDIKAESSEEEVSRDRGAIKGDNGVPLFDLVTLKGTLQAANLKGEAVTLRIRRDFTGDLVAAEGDPDVKKTTKGLRDTNSTGRLTWTKTVEPGHPLRLAYTYKVYVRAQ